MDKIKKLTNAKAQRNDEFYTLYEDIVKEVERYVEVNPDIFRGKTVMLPCDDPERSNFTRYFLENFKRYGLKRLISSSYNKSGGCGKVCIVENPDEVVCHALNGDGDFRSDEVCQLREKADFIITNPPFSIFGDFFEWLVESGKKFLIVANKTCVTYKLVFPLLKENKLWSGYRRWGGGMWFESDKSNFDKIVDGKWLKNIGACWLTNMEHKRRFERLENLKTIEENKVGAKYNRLAKVGCYQKYDNYDIIEVPFVDMIPSDCYEVMGVPVSFIDKYNPEQFEIIGTTDVPGFREVGTGWNGKKAKCVFRGKPKFSRVFIKAKNISC